jgi:hypothetical protein
VEAVQGWLTRSLHDAASRASSSQHRKGAAPGWGRFPGKRGFDSRSVALRLHRKPSSTAMDGRAYTLSATGYRRGTRSSRAFGSFARPYRFTT